ncbi:MAG TPA: hypothetical protein VHW09_05370 [Bryobacteraceae bacterium]|jgi:hypothetical protein|nr:hypothetical protein [Bryobacteraceae bacterium]
MCKWLWIAPLLAAGCWAQTGTAIPSVIPVTPLGGFVVPSGTVLNVRIDEALSTDRNQPGDPFTATLMDPVAVNGTVVLPMGTHLKGHVLANHAAGVWKGHASLVLGLDSIQLSGRTFPLQLTSATCENPHKHKKLEDPDPNAKAATGDRLAVAVKAETVVHFTLGAAVRV